MKDDKKRVTTTSIMLTPETVNRLKVLKGILPKRSHEDVVIELIDYYVKNSKLNVKV